MKVAMGCIHEKAFQILVVSFLVACGFIGGVESGGDS